MDFHKLQQTLHEIEPSDPTKDLEQLRQAAQGNNSPEPRAPVPESRTQSHPVATSHELSEAEQFAALAGIRIDEGQKKGRAGQARGSDPMPKKSKPSRSGEQKHPLKDKLVGSSIGYEETEVDEGPKWDQVKQDWEKGKKEFNNPRAFKGVLSKGKKKKSKPSQSQASTPKASNNALPPNVANALTPYATALSNVLRNPRLKNEFNELMKAADPKLQLEAYKESRRSSASGDAETIKEELLRRLNNRK